MRALGEIGSAGTVPKNGESKTGLQNVKFTGLTINAYGSRLQRQDKSSLQFAECKSFNRENATEEENRICKFLDEEKVFQLDAKQALYDQIEKECHSPILAAQFHQKAITQSVNQLKGPSFLQRRMEMRNNQQTVNDVEKTNATLMKLRSSNLPRVGDSEQLVPLTGPSVNNPSQGITNKRGMMGLSIGISKRGLGHGDIKTADTDSNFQLKLIGDIGLQSKKDQVVSATKRRLLGDIGQQDTRSSSDASSDIQGGYPDKQQIPDSREDCQSIDNQNIDINLIGQILQSKENKSMIANSSVLNNNRAALINMQESSVMIKGSSINNQKLMQNIDEETNLSDQDANFRTCSQ
eukprot:403346058